MHRVRRLVWQHDPGTSGAPSQPEAFNDNTAQLAVLRHAPTGNSQRFAMGLQTVQGHHIVALQRNMPCCNSRFTYRFGPDRHRNSRLLHIKRQGKVSERAGMFDVMRG